MTVDAQDLSPQPSDNFSAMYPTGSSVLNQRYVEPHDIDHNSPYITFDSATGRLFIMPDVESNGHSRLRYISRPPLRYLFIVPPLYITHSFLVYSLAYTLVHIVYRSCRIFTSSNFASFRIYHLLIFNPLPIRI